MSAGATMEGTDRIAEAIRTAILKHKAATGIVEVAVVPGGKRGTAKNALIARVQAAMQRNPWYLDKDTMTMIRFLARGLTDEMRAPEALKRIGDLMVDAVRKNIEAQRGPGGKTFRELTAAYAAFKRRKNGFISPILRATGDLLDNLKAVITRR
jgi:hypothetical protein